MVERCKRLNACVHDGTRKKEKSRKTRIIRKEIWARHVKEERKKKRSRKEVDAF